VRTRALPVALLMIVWRLVRCNLLASGRSPDPVTRRGVSVRPNAVPTALAALAVVGLVALVGTETVGAQNLDGGCTASANGRDPVTMTAKDPLVVHKGERVDVTGTVPAAIAAQPADQIQSLTTIHVSLVEGLIETSTEAHPGTGPQWGDSVAVDDYLKWGVGLYKVDGTASGDGWVCSGDGYVKLDDGSPLGKPVGQAAAALTVLGAGGAVLASRRPWSTEAAARARSTGPTAKEVKADFKADAERLLGVEDKPQPQPFVEWLGNLGCGVFGLIAMALFALPAGVVGAAAAPAAAAGAGAGTGRRVWLRGHPIAGFLSGVVAGLGLTVLAQQFAIWPLTIATLIAFPVLIGVLSAVRAWRGRPFRYSS